jgi:hypothetical protein
MGHESGSAPVLDRGSADGYTTGTSTRNNFAQTQGTDHPGESPKQDAFRREVVKILPRHPLPPSRFILHFAFLILHFSIPCFSFVLRP